MAMKTPMLADAEVHADVDLMTEGEVAKALKIAAGSLRNARVSGSLKIPFIKLGTGKRSPIRYRRTEVSSYLDSRTVSNTRQAQDVGEGQQPIMRPTSFHVGSVPVQNRTGTTDWAEMAVVEGAPNDSSHEPIDQFREGA